MTTYAPVPPVAVPAGGMGSFYRGVRVVWQRELLRFWNDRLRIFTVLVQPLLFVFVLGNGLGSITRSVSGVSYKTFVYPGALAMSVLFTAVFSAGSIVWDREFGFLREMLVAPVSRLAIVVGKCLGGATTATAQGILVLALAGLVGIPYSPVMILILLGELALLAFTVTAFGVMISARVRTFQGFMGLTQMLLMPLFFTSGAMFPLSGLPGWLHVVTRLNPLTYAVDPIRRVVFHYLDVGAAARAVYAPGVTWGGYHVPIWLELVIVAASGLAMLGVAGLEFRDSE
ncbi:ABC transporter permease [Wenjunlia tyrosinilytica]|uniref:Transport permease protein n=1 Tax=Wenjunlia tyrosinilytica TaxID=1544741 RepID=A0A917ZTZ6_9ACTN|nr:ABC transporter permease [Wenjunlia tyrosinilytica]GGO95046.1 transport permease protein [Wenjunlia tyrosinilytica]